MNDAEHMRQWREYEYYNGGGFTADLIRQSHDDFVEQMQGHVLANPVCEVCDRRPSVRINRWGTIKACCQDCLDEEQRRFDEHCAAEREYDEEYGW